MILSYYACIVIIALHYYTVLLGGYNPSENTSQIGNLPQIGVKNKENIWNYHLVH